MTDRVQLLFRRALRREGDSRTREVVATLREVPLFQGLTRRALRDLAEAVHVRTYRRDEVLYYEGDPGLGLYVVQEGRVRLVVEDEPGTVQELRLVSDHGVFGLLSVLGDYRRLESAQAVTEARVIGFFRPDLRTLIKRHPASGAAIGEVLAREIARQQGRLVASLADRDGKLAALRLLHEHGR